MRCAASAEAGGEPRIADLYCGVGTFGILLAHGAKEVFGVESDPENLRFLRKNLFANRVGNYAVCEGTERGMDRGASRKGRRSRHRRSAAPRPRAVAWSRALAERPVAALIYLSCNPATLARDLKGLGQTYVPETVKVLDFFPHTPHIETLVVLKRGEP